jgi:hypothetical protein
LLAFLPLVISLACGGTDDSGGDPEASGQSADVSRACTELCQHWRSVGCGDPLTDCDQNCTKRWSTAPGAACSDEVVTYYGCEVGRPAAEYLCRGSLPTYNGTACSAEDTTAQACIAAQTQPQPSCEQYCDLQATACGITDVEACKQSCANLTLLGDCADAATAFYDCVLPLATSRLICDAGLVKSGDGSCDAALNAVGSCKP